MAISGTLPAVYKGATFNVPIRLTYYEGYPGRPPVVQVTPTPDMMVKSNEFVREDGTVVSALMQRWTAQCNTKVLFDDLIAAFNYKMPVFSRGAKAQGQPASQSMYAQPPQPMYTQPSLPAYTQPGQTGFSQPQPGYSLPAQTQFSQSGYMPPSNFQGPGPSQFGPPQQSNNSSALSTLLQEQYNMRASELISELEILDKEKSALVQSTEDIEQARKAYLQDQSMANGRVAAIDSAKEGMKAWIAANSNADVATLPLETLLAVENPHSVALLDALSKESAYEDAANVLVDAFGLRKCSTEDFVRTLKNLYREQFMELQVKEKSLQVLRPAAR